MTTSLLLSTRKGLFVAQRGGASAAAWRITGPHFAGEPVTFTYVDPRSGHWYSALRLGHFGVKLKRSPDRGASWQDLAAPALPAKPSSGPWAADPTPWSVDLVWTVTAGGADRPGVLWAGCLPAGLFRSADDGQSWQLIESLWFNEQRLGWFGGGYDHAAIHSIVVDPRDSSHITVAISCGGIWDSRDDGATWTLIGRGQIATYVPEGASQDLNTQDPHRLDICAARPDVVWVQHHCGVFRSVNGALDFEPLQPPAGYDFGFAVAADPTNPERAWFVPADSDAKRYAIDGALCVMRTDDGGRSFRLFRAGLPQQQAWQLVYRHALVVDSEGQSLAMASTTGSVWTSDDAGEHWQVLEGLFPPVAALAWDSATR